jgi:hypothetical protein
MIDAAALQAFFWQEIGRSGPPATYQARMWR